MRFFLNLDNFFFLFIFQCLIIWLNFFLLLKKNFLIKSLENKNFYSILDFFLFKDVYKIKKTEFIQVNLFKINYFFYNNTIKCLI
jgi:hypothetical protein